jgi:hypothetical protein
MVWSLSFDSSVTAWSGRSAGAIVDIACDLIERMRVNGVGNRTLVFIAHSMGGLIVKQILRVAEYAPLHVNLIENLRGIIFFATPHFGSDLSSLARTLRWLLLPTVGLLDMVANDPHLIELNAWFRSFATRLRIRVLALIETQPVARSKWLPFLSVSVVPFAYANPALDSAEVWRVDGTDHISICKPISKTSEVYQRCVTFIGACKEAPSPHRVSVAPLKRNVWRLPRPMNPEGFIGRKHYLDLLESCWRERRSQVFELIADGGIGKSTIVWRWIQDIVNFRSSVDKDCGIFAWSFYDQGRHEYFPNSDDFLLEAGQHFGLSPNPTNMIDHATRIAEVFAVRGGILILDGLEPLQYSPIKYDGALKDPALIAFFKQLFAQPSPHDNSALPNRMLVVTTRFRMGDPFGVGHERIDLSRLDEDEGIELLKRLTLGSQKLHVTPESQLSEQCRNLVRECEGHALSLVLIGTYLITRFRGDLRRRSDFEQILKDPSRSAQASHAHRVMDAYEQLFDSGDLPLKRCRAVLFQLSLFDRPTHALFLRLFCCEASGITVGEEMTHTQQREAITYLRLIKLIEPAAIPDDGAISTHPLVRLHFRAAFRATDPVGYRAAHLHVANYLLTNLDSEKAESFFERVFQAIVHACLAEHFSDAFEGIYKPYLCAKQSRRAQQEGMYAKLVTVLSYFVVGDEWGKTRLSAEPEQNLSEAAQLVIHMHAGANLTAAKGYAAEEVGQAYAGARQLACVLQDTRAELIALYGLWRYEIVGARMDSAAKLAREVEELGSRLEAWPTARYVVTRTTVTGMFYTGAFSKVVSTSADYLLDKDWLGADGAAKDLETEAVVTLTMYAAISSWYLGDVEDALLLSEQAEAMARRAGKTHTLAIALFFRGVVADFVEDFGVLSQVAGELGQLTATQDLVLWNAAGEFMGARAKCQTEPTPDYPNGYRQMVVALGRWVDTGAQLLTPFFYSRLAILAMNMGAFDKAESHIQAGLARSSSEGGEQWTRGELLRLRGVL